jgi:Alanine dehydrogenase
VGAHYLQCDGGGKGVLLSRTDDAPGGKVVVVGGGAVGRAAAEVAAGVGARVTVFDLFPRALRAWGRLHPGVRLRRSESRALAQALREADLVIGAVYVPGARAPQVIRRAMVRRMEPGSVLVDVAVDQGGAAETTRPTTHSHPVYLKYGVIHYAVTNMPALVGRSAAQSLSRAIEPYVRKIAAKKSLRDITRDPVLRSAVNVAEGEILNPAVRASLIR